MKRHLYIRMNAQIKLNYSHVSIWIGANGCFRFDSLFEMGFVYDSKFAVNVDAKCSSDFY